MSRKCLADVSFDLDLDLDLDLNLDLDLELYASVCDKGHFGNKVKRDCRIAVSNRSYDRLNMV